MRAVTPVPTLRPCSPPRHELPRHPRHRPQGAAHQHAALGTDHARHHHRRGGGDRHDCRRRRRARAGGSADQKSRRQPDDGLLGLTYIYRRPWRRWLDAHHQRGRRLRHRARTTRICRQHRAGTAWQRAGRRRQQQLVNLVLWRDAGLFRRARMEHRRGPFLRAGGNQRRSEGRHHRQDRRHQPVRRRQPTRPDDPHPHCAAHRDRLARQQGAKPRRQRSRRRDPDADYHRAQPRAGHHGTRQVAVGRFAPDQAARCCRQQGSRGKGARTAAPAPSPAAGTGRRLHAAQHDRDSPDARRVLARDGAAARRRRVGFAAGRRHRHHEHHARLGHRAHPRDRPAARGRRARAATSCSSSSSRPSPCR